MPRGATVGQTHREYSSLLDPRFAIGHGEDCWRESGGVDLYRNRLAVAVRNGASAECNVHS